jgi:aromatic ring-opening dioxygenase catalytic subunit (LigB family)
MNESNSSYSRRAVVGGLATVATAVLAAHASGGEHGPQGNGAGNREPDAARRAKAGAGGRLPVIYLPHGGGPWPFVDLGMPKQEFDSLAGYLKGLAAVLPQAPKALLVISAHWEEAVPTVQTGANPPLLFDYYGFPPASYELTWPAPGDPKLAARVRELLTAANIPSAEDPTRGFDHGTFVPLKLAWPDAKIPTVQLSLKKGLNASEHLALGRALAPLREEGVLILGSGMSFHNMRAFQFRGGGAAGDVGADFDRWLHETTPLPAADRDRRLAGWADAPGARYAHPREEHLLPLMVIAGAAGEDRGAAPFAGTVLGARVSAFHFG